MCDEAQAKKFIRDGRQSGIPECCIKFFVSYWDSPGAHSYRQAIDAVQQEYITHIQYIPCPDCLKKRSFVYVKNTRKRRTERKKPKSLYRTFAVWACNYCPWVQTIEPISGLDCPACDEGHLMRETRKEKIPRRQGNEDAPK